MISIGLVSGPQSSKLEHLCRELMAAFERARKAFDGHPLVNVVFHSPLALKRADFDGMVVGNFAKKDAKVLIAIAVPLVVTQLDDDESVKEYVMKNLHEALELGAAQFHLKAIAIDRNALFKFEGGVIAALWGKSQPTQ